MMPNFYKLGFIVPFILCNPLNLLAKELGSLKGKVEIQADFNYKKGNFGAVVYFVKFSEPAPRKPAVINQKKSQFIPDVMPIVKGQRVIFRNRDKVDHNVFSVSSAQPFDLGLGQPGATHEMKFERTGKIDIYCNIHPEMVATLLVLPNSKFAVTDRDGNFEIKGVRPGKHKIYAWHPLGRPKKKMVTIQGQKATEANWTLKIKKPLPHKNKRGRAYKKNRRLY